MPITSEEGLIITIPHRCNCKWWQLTFSPLRFPFYYCTFTDRRGTNMLLWERKCPFYVERKYNSLHKFLSLHTYITDCKQIQWFPINFVGPSNGNYYEESNGTKIMKCTQVLDGEKDQKPLFRYEKVGAQRSKMPHRHLENWPFAAGCIVTVETMRLLWDEFWDFWQQVDPH